MKFLRKNTPNEPIELPKQKHWRDMYENGGSLNLAASISAEVARLVTLEMASKIYGSKRAELLDNSYQKLIQKARNFCELTCAIGGVMLKPYISSGIIETAIVPNDSFKITSVSQNGDILGVQFFENTVKDSKRYIKCEEHTILNDNYIITNTVYLDNDGVKKEVPLSEVELWADLEKQIILQNVSSALFSYFGMPFIVRGDLSSPLGEPIFARSVKLIEDANKQYERLLWEFESGERALYVDETAVKRSKNGDALLPEKRLYRTLLTGNDELFCDWTPTLRDNSLINGLERILQRIEFNSGLAYGTLSDPQAVDKTAEEIRASKQRSYATVTEIQSSLKNALLGWAKAADILCDIYSLAPSDSYEMSFTFDDSIVTDRQSEFAERMTLLDKGVITKEEMRFWYLGEGAKNNE